MKFNISKYIASAFFLLIAFAAQAQLMNQKIEMKVDSIGDAELTVSMTMNAQQWDNWLKSIGNNPAAMKREMERALPAYFLDEFELEKDDMNRSFNLTFKAYGVCEVDRKGRWVMTTDRKDAQITELTEHKYMLVESPQEFAGSIQQTTMIEFPEEAHDIEMDKDAYGKTIFEFEMEEQTGGADYMQWAGIALLLIGGAGTVIRART